VRDVEVEFAVRDGASIAYEVFGRGPVDLVLPAGMTTPIDLMWELPKLAEFLDALGELARVIAYDARGFGASDSMPTTEGAAGIEIQAADFLAVLEAAGSARATICSVLAASSFELAFAAIYPERVRSIILSNFRSSFPEMRGMTSEQRLSTARWLATPAGLKFFNPRVAHDPVLRRWWGRGHRLGGSPEQVARQMEYAAEIDVSSLLGQVRAPVLVFHREDNQMWDVETSRATTALMPTARFVQLPGSETDLYLGDTAPVLAEIKRFLLEPDDLIDDDMRRLATVLFTDIVSSTERLASVGDQAWRGVLDEHDRTIDELVVAHRGRVVKRLGDGILATFDGPARAVRSATAIREALAAHGVTVRAGLHTGEIELRGDDVTGMAVHTGARVAAMAEGGEVLVSSTVKDLVGGSGIAFEDRGEHELKGVPGTWKLFAVRD
jgi:class 3 adenylate cyclase